MAAKSRGARGGILEDSLQEDVRNQLRSAVIHLGEWRQRLEALVEQLPIGEYADGTDDPLDLPAAWRGLIESTMHDELAPTIESLERASRFTSDPATWYPRG